MKKIFAVIILFSAALNLFAQQRVLNINSLLERILKENLDLRLASSGSESAYQNYLKLLTQEKMGVSFFTDTGSSPLYGYSSGVPSYTALGALQSSTIHTLSGGLAVSGGLPGGGGVLWFYRTA